MKKELYTFFAALMFLTRLPIPKWVKYDEMYLQKSTRYFSLVGLIVGVIQAAIYIFLEKLLPSSIAILLTMAAGLLLTGAFHEDGFADMCDAFGGGYTKEKILEIMKDSRLGTYGTAGLIMILLLKFVLLQQLAGTLFSFDEGILVNIPYYLEFPLLIILAQSLSRCMPLLIIQFGSYVYQTEASKSKPLASQKLSLLDLYFSFAISLAGFTFLPLKYFFVIVPMLLATFILGRYFNKHLQGYTGDCLGATQQIVEIVFYLFIIIINKIVI